MALKKIQPFTYAEYAQLVQHQLPAIISGLSGRAVDGKESCSTWFDLFKSYTYRGAGYEEGIKVRDDFHHKLRNGSPELRSDVVNEILIWGGMKPLRQRDQMHEVLESLRLLDIDANGKEHHGRLGKDLYAERIASVSKVYEMWSPDHWVIYDSYSARGLEWIISKASNGAIEAFNPRLLKFPCPADRSDIGPYPGFPILAQSSASKQPRLAFVYASWLCRLIADHLNKTDQDQDFQWKAFHVEMALFQLGHDVVDEMRSDLKIA